MLTGKPNTRAIDAPRFSSSKRSSFGAIATEPRCWKPVACPVSSSNVANRFVVYCARRVRFCVARNCPTKPAACHVVPLVSCLRSNNTTSETPRFAKW